MTDNPKLLIIVYIFTGIIFLIKYLTKKSNHNKIKKQFKEIDYNNNYNNIKHNIQKKENQKIIKKNLKVITNESDDEKYKRNTKEYIEAAWEEVIKNP